MPNEFSKNSLDQQELRSTPGEFDRFISSKMWFDMRETIKDRIEYLRESLVALPNTADANYEMIAIKNQMKAWNEMLGMPSLLKTFAHAEQSNRKQDSNEDN